MFLLKERQRQSHSVGKKRSQDEFAVSRTNRWIGCGSWFPGSFPVQMKPVIQRCGSDEEEEKPEANYEGTLSFFRSKIEDVDSVEIFEENAEYEEEDFYKCILYIIDKRPELLFSDKIRRTMGVINDCGITIENLHDFGCKLFQYRPGIIQKIIESGESYEQYDVILLRSNLPKEIEQIFIKVKKADLDALAVQIGMQTLEYLLYQSIEAVSFIENQSVLRPWLVAARIESTLKIGFEKCMWLAQCFSPDQFFSIPLSAERIQNEDLETFFRQCHDLFLGDHTIEEMTRRKNQDADTAKPPEYQRLMKDDPLVLLSFRKENHFVDWIKVLGYLFSKGKVILIPGKREMLPVYSGKPVTEEIKILVGDTSGGLLEDFVYHEHPKEKDKALSYRHIKPNRGSSATVHISYDEIPEFIKTLLGI
ncbi:MAG: hypothetical protein NC307_11920 [Roseburia sp.]|nr:hypothetical protein [Roseburia sp.]